MASPFPAFANTEPAAGPHVLDASMFWNPCGGVHRVLSTKAAWLKAQGWRHTLLAPGAVDADQLDCGGLPLPGSGGYSMVHDGRRAERLISWACPDIVEAADPYTLAHATLRATARLGIPAVAFCHSNLPQIAACLAGGSAGAGSARGRWAARRASSYLVDLYAQFDMVLAPSRDMADQLRDWGLGQVLVQPLGVDCERFTPAARDPEWRRRLMRHLGLHPTVRLLVYTGRFAPEKNLQVLADAVRVLGTGHALLAVGAGPHPPRGPGVHLLPVETDTTRLARIVANCDAYVHAGDQETFGMGALEAMACGTPVVVSGQGGLGELAHEVGITVMRREPQDWAAAVSACLLTAHPRLRDAALRRARQHDWPVVLHQLARRYTTLLRRQHGVDQGSLSSSRSSADPRLPVLARMQTTADPRMAPQRNSL